MSNKQGGKGQSKTVDNCIIKDCAIRYNGNEFFCDSDDHSLTIERCIINFSNESCLIRDIDDRLSIRNCIISVKRIDRSNERYALAEATFNIESSASDDDGDADCALVA